MAFGRDSALRRKPGRKRGHGCKAVGLHDECVEELREREIELSVERVVTGVHIGKPHKEFEVDIPERFLVYKIRIGECFEISPRGVVRQEGI